MSLKKGDKSHKSCLVSSHIRSLEVELEEKNDKIRALEHDLNLLRLSLKEKDKLLQQEQERHENEMKETRTKQHHALQSIEFAQSNYDQSLLNMTQTCEGFEQDNELLNRIIKKQKKKIFELSQSNADNVHRIKKLTEGIQAIEDGESSILNDMKEVCDGQEAELKQIAIKNQKLIEENKLSVQRNQDFEEEQKNNLEVLSEILDLMKLNDGDLEVLSEVTENTSPVLSINSQLLELKKIVKRFLQRDTRTSKKKSKFSPKSISISPKAHQELKTMHETNRSQTPNTATSTKSGESFFSESVTTTKSHKSVFTTNEDISPSVSEIRSILSLSTSSKVLKLTDIVNKSLYHYFRFNTNEYSESWNFLSSKSLKIHDVKDFGAPKTFWYSTLSIRKKVWDPSFPSAEFEFPGGLVGSRLGKIVYSNQEHATEALLLYVLKNIDPTGKWTEEFLHPDDQFCVLRKEGTLRNAPWLTLIRKGGHIYLAYVKDVATIKPPIMIA